MTAGEIVAALRALADSIERNGKASVPQPKPITTPVTQPKPASGAKDAVAGIVQFWDVKVRDNGKSMASLKLQTGERFVCFDGDLISRIDPLHRGDRVVVSLKPWTKKDGTVESLIANVTKSTKPGGIWDDEIPL